MSDVRWRPNAAAVIAMLLLSACSSRPVRFYTLIDSASAPSSPASSGPPLAFVLDAVSVPRQVDIPQLIVGSEGGALKLAEDRRWIAPVGDEIRAALSQHLQTRLGAFDVSRVSAPAGMRVVRVRVDVQRFESVAGGQALVAALWSVREGDAANAATSCMMHAQEPAGAGYAALVQGYRRAVATLAAQIADGITALGHGPGSCPGAKAE